jgi:hypothetical protein
MFGGLGLGFNETNGSVLTSPVFSATGSQLLDFNFNFVTSDGAGFPEYAYVQLLPSGGGTPILLFTARTCQTTPCDTVPGTAMPPLGLGVVLNPASTPIIANATHWSPLGGSSGTCWAVGCGNSGWIDMHYMPAAGTYQLQMGVVNVNDTAFDTGLGVAGATIGGVAVGQAGDATVPEPATLVLFGTGLLAAARRRYFARRNG